MSLNLAIFLSFAVGPLLWYGLWRIVWMRDNLRSHTDEWRDERIIAWIKRDLPPLPSETLPSWRAEAAPAERIARHHDCSHGHIAAWGESWCRACGEAIPCVCGEPVPW